MTIKLIAAATLAAAVASALPSFADNPFSTDQMITVMRDAILANNEKALNTEVSAFHGSMDLTIRDNDERAAVAISRTVCAYLDAHDDAHLGFRVYLVNGNLAGECKAR